MDNIGNEQEVYNNNGFEQPSGDFVSPDASSYDNSSAVMTDPNYPQDAAPYYAPIAPFVPMEPIYPAAPVSKPMVWRAPPLLVFFALIICLPVGLILLLFFTRWGAFAKFFITLFVIICVWALYELLCFYSILDMPSLLQMIIDLFN